MKALLIGNQPPLGYEYVTEAPYDAVVIGSLTLGQLLRFREDRVLDALAQGLPVVLYAPGLPVSPKNRALSAAIASAKRELKNWGVVFSEGNVRHVITAQQARELRLRGERPAPGAVLTPLAKEILEE
jgi:sulfur relay (sulfurtransferase) DsrF/TusC family protein